MAPSMKVIGIGSGGGSWEGEEEKRLKIEERRRRGFGLVSSDDLVARRLAITFTLLGEMAFRSTKVRHKGAAVVPRRAFRAVTPAGT